MKFSASDIQFAQTKSVLKSLSQRLIIKNTVPTNVAVLQPTGGSWKSIMKKRLLEMGQLVAVKSVGLS